MKKKILVVDDEVAFTRLLKLNLEEIGNFEVRVENKPRQALRAAQEFRPDFIFLDIIMAEMDGGDVAGEIRRDDKLKSVPIVFLTATVRKHEIASRKGKIGGYSFVAKPASVEDLLQAIQTNSR
jgi:CheY-like chemotaxis protein